ncbi:hypothetical protein N2152v2_010830 [Parachlorella kessleri]
MTRKGRVKTVVNVLAVGTRLIVPAGENLQNPAARDTPTHRARGDSRNDVRLAREGAALVRFESRATGWSADGGGGDTAIGPRHQPLLTPRLTLTLTLTTNPGLDLPPGAAGCRRRGRQQGWGEATQARPPTESLAAQEWAIHGAAAGAEG